MKKLEPISQAVPPGSEDAWVQVNFTAENYPSADGSDRYAARPIEAFIRVVPATAVSQARLDNPIQSTSFRANPVPVNCEFAYFTTQEVKDVLRWAMQYGYGVPTSGKHVDVSEILEHIEDVRFAIAEVSDAIEVAARAVNALK